MDVKSIENLAKLMKENGLTSLELAQEGISLKLERKSAPEPAQGALRLPLCDGPCGAGARAKERIAGALPNCGSILRGGFAGEQPLC